MDEVIENKKVIYKNSFISVERELFNDKSQNYISDISSGVQDDSSRK